MPTFPRGHAAYRSRQKNTKLLAALVCETGGNLKVERGRRGFEFPEAADLRGLPACGRGVAGAIRGTRPGDR